MNIPNGADWVTFRITLDDGQDAPNGQTNPLLCEPTSIELINASFSAPSTTPPTTPSGEAIEAIDIDEGFFNTLSTINITAQEQRTISTAFAMTMPVIIIIFVFRAIRNFGRRRK